MIEFLALVYVVTITALLRRWSSLMAADLDMTSAALLDRAELNMEMTLYEVGNSLLPVWQNIMRSFSRAASNAAEIMRGFDNGVRATSQALSELDMTDSA